MELDSKPRIAIELEKNEAIDFEVCIHLLNERVDVDRTTLKKTIEELQNEIQYIPNHTWRNMVIRSNKYEKVGMHKSRKISRAYFKLYEILVDFNVHSKLASSKEFECVTSLHLCEGPGGFIQATQDWCRSNDLKLEWTSITLRPSVRDTNLPDFDYCTFGQDQNITYGEDGTGNIYSMDNIKHMHGIVLRKSKGKGANLITADGGFDVSHDPSNQELLSSKLMFAQALSALQNQSIGGIFIMKIFDISLRITHDLIYILKTYYKDVYITKPLTSRPCNSEKYLVCSDFKGIDEEHIHMMYQILEIWNSLQDEEYIESVLSAENVTKPIDLSEFHIHQFQNLKRTLNNKVYTKVQQVEHAHCFHSFYMDHHNTST